MVSREEETNEDLERASEVVSPEPLQRKTSLFVCTNPNSTAERVSQTKHELREAAKIEREGKRSGQSAV